MTIDYLTFESPLRALLLSVLVGALALTAGTVLSGCDAGGMNDDGDNFIAPSTSRVGWEVEPGTADSTQQFTLTYNSLDVRPSPPDDIPEPFALELVEETGTPSEGTSVYNVTFTPGDEITTFTEKIVFEAGDRYVTIQFFGFVGFNDTLITDYAGSGVVSEIGAFNGLASGNLEGQLTMEGTDLGGPNVFAGVFHILEAPVDFGETPVLVATMKVSADSDTPAIVRAALNQAGDPGLPDANSSVPPLIKEIPNDGEYRQYYFDFRDLFVQFDGQPVDETNIGEIVFLVNDGGSLGALGTSDTFTGTVFVDRLARRPDIPGEDNGGGGGGDTNESPSASFSFEPSEPEIGSTVTFTDESTDADGSIESREWDFGDGNTATGASATNTYQSAGDFTVSLTVTDDDGATSTTSQTVTVIDPDAQPTAFRGDDDGDGQIIFDDFEDGVQDGEYFTFSDTGDRTGLTDGSDVPMGSSGAVSLVANINGGSGGGFAGYGKGTDSDVPAEGIDVSALGPDPYFTMYFKSDVTEAYTLEINLQEDQDGNGIFDGSGSQDDEFQATYLVDPNETGYTRLSIPFSAFADRNSVNNGGDGELSDRIANVVFAIGGLPAEQFSFTVDDIIYSDTDLGTGGGGTANGTACDNIGGYELIKEDNFDSFDEAFWDAGTATFNGNRATFRRENISFADGKMIFTLKKEQFNGKPYTGAELRTDNTDGFYGYGCYEVRMKSAGPSGTVSSFFGYRFNPWQEIDIEIVGKNNNGMLTNIYFNEGPEGEANNDPFQVPPFPRNVGLTYDASQEFHNYAFEWLPGEIKWYRDGELVKVATVDGADPNQIPDIEMQIMMNLWVSSAESFAGPIDDSNFPVQSEYDWVRLYRPTP